MANQVAIEMSGETHKTNETQPSRKLSFLRPEEQIERTEQEDRIQRLQVDRATSAYFSNPRINEKSAGQKPMEEEC
jgi:hypothetical protein